MTPLEEIREYARVGYSPKKIFCEEDFINDFKVFQAAKRTVNSFLKSGEIEEKLLINHVILALNSFGKQKTNKIFRCMMDDVQFSVVKAILMFLGQYDYSLAQEVYPNRIMIDILRDITHRYNICST